MKIPVLTTVTEIRAKYLCGCDAHCLDRDTNLGDVCPDHQAHMQSWSRTEHYQYSARTLGTMPGVVKLSAPVHRSLQEAFRRFECFAIRAGGYVWDLPSLMRAHTGLGPASAYKAVQEAGYMTSHSNFVPRTTLWWGLTEKGAKVVLAWHRLGATCDGGFEVKTTLPAYVYIGESEKEHF